MDFINLKHFGDSQYTLIRTDEISAIGMDSDRNVYVMTKGLAYDEGFIILTDKRLTKEDREKVCEKICDQIIKTIGSKVVLSELS